MDAKQLASLEPALNEFIDGFRKCFHAPTFKHFRTYLLGLMEDLPRKNIETIAMSADTAVRTLQEFLSQLAWDHDRLHELYQHLVADRHACDGDRRDRLQRPSQAGPSHARRTAAVLW